MRRVEGKLDQGIDETAAPGTFAFMADGRELLFMCPCGCRDLGYLPLTPRNPPGEHWTWDGNRELPTLSPSIQRIGGCGWHGFLRAGVWESC